MAVARRVCSKCGKNRAIRFYVSERGRVCSTCRKQRTRNGSREKRLMDAYSLTLEEYAAILELQDGVCAICKRKPRYNLDVDHDHAIYWTLVDDGVPPPKAMRMSLRGLLCKQCNRHLLPAVKDNETTLQRACNYLQYPPAVEVLQKETPWIY